jgi:hypothetical protein
MAMPLAAVTVPPPPISPPFQVMAPVTVTSLAAALKRPLVWL